MVTDKQDRIGSELFCSAIALLGGQTDKASAFIEAIWQSGRQPRRFFHTPEHYLNVAGIEDALQRKAAGLAPFASAWHALRFKAGCEHDVAYLHVDAKAGGEALHPRIRTPIETLARIEDTGENCVSLIYDFAALGAHKTALIGALNVLFHQPATAQRVQLEWYHNQNEYLSALFSLASGLALELTDKWLLAEMALIEATVPFGAPGRLPALRARLEKANQLLESPLTHTDISEMMLQCEAISNRDVGDFELYFGDFIAGSFQLLLENSKGAVSGHNAYAIDPILMATSMAGMADYLSAIADTSEQQAPARSFFHCADGSRHPMEETAIENIRKLAHYLREARTDIQLLCNDFSNSHPKAPKHWGAICQHLGINIEQTPQSPHAFFHTLGAPVLMEYAAGYRPRSAADTPATQPILKLEELKRNVDSEIINNQIGAASGSVTS